MSNGFRGIEETKIDAALVTSQKMILKVPNKDKNLLMVEEEKAKEWVVDLKEVLKENSVKNLLLDDFLKFVLGGSFSIGIGAIFSGKKLEQNILLYFSCAIVFIICLACIACKKQKMKITIFDKISRILNNLEKILKEGE